MADSVQNLKGAFASTPASGVPIELAVAVAVSIAVLSNEVFVVFSDVFYASIAEVSAVFSVVYCVSIDGVSGVFSVDYDVVNVKEHWSVYPSVGTEVWSITKGSLASGRIREDFRFVWVSSLRHRAWSPTMALVDLRAPFTTQTGIRTS